MLEAQELYSTVRGEAKSESVSDTCKAQTVGESEEVTEDVNPVSLETRQEPVQAAQAEVHSNKDARDVEKVDDEVSEDILVSGDDVLVSAEAEGGTSGGSADPEGQEDLDVTTIRQGMSRCELAEETGSDPSLVPLLKLGELDREGYHVSQGLLFRTRRNMFDGKIEQLCVPQSQRSKCLTAAHTSFRHQGRNKMLMLLQPHFYWSNMSRSCRDFVRGCECCQAADKTTPKPQTMTERPVVTQPFSDVAIDLVGPFPTAVGGGGISTC